MNDKHTLEYAVVSAGKKQIFVYHTTDMTNKDILREASKIIVDNIFWNGSLGHPKVERFYRCPSCEQWSSESSTCPASRAYYHAES